MDPRAPVPPLPFDPSEPFDPDEVLELAGEPDLYEEDEPGPHLIEVRIGEDEAETEELPARPTHR